MNPELVFQREIQEAKAAREAQTKLDDLIDEWHLGDSELSLHEYLGVSTDDYAAWVMGRSSASELLAKRKEVAP